MQWTLTRLAHSLRVTTKRALVLAGGGLAGIGWETGILRGIADESPATAKALLESDVLVGTSAGSTVAAQLGSGLGLDALFDRQTPVVDRAQPGRRNRRDHRPVRHRDVDAQHDDGREAAEDRRGRAVDADGDRSGAARRDRAAAAVARLAGPGAADLRDRHRDRRTGRVRPELGRGACRRGGRQLRGAWSVAAGDDRRAPLHGRRRRQHRQHGAGERLRRRRVLVPSGRRHRRRSAAALPRRSTRSAGRRSVCSPTTSRSPLRRQPARPRVPQTVRTCWSRARPAGCRCDRRLPRSLNQLSGVDFSSSSRTAAASSRPTSMTSAAR